MVVPLPDDESEDVDDDESADVEEDVEVEVDEPWLPESPDDVEALSEPERACEPEREPWRESLRESLL